MILIFYFFIYYFLLVHVPINNNHTYDASGFVNQKTNYPNYQYCSIDI